MTAAALLAAFTVAGLGFAHVSEPGPTWTVGTPQAAGALGGDQYQWDHPIPVIDGMTGMATPANTWDMQ